MVYGPGACCQGAPLHLPDLLEGLHGGYVRLSSPSSLGTKGVACSLRNRRCTGGAFAWAAAKSGSSSATAAKCELCLSTQWCGPPILRGSSRSPSTMQFNACWLTTCEGGPLRPGYRASCALRGCAPMMEASTMCTVRWDGGVCKRYVTR